VELLMAMDGKHKVNFNSQEKESITFEGLPISKTMYEEEKNANIDFVEDFFEEEEAGGGLCARRGPG
jgi:hypothetical protein